MAIDTASLTGGFPAEVQSARAQGQTEGIDANGRFWTTQPTASNDVEAWFTGKKKMSDVEAEYRAHLRDLQSAREAREWEKKEADSAWQRKVGDLEKAGFSPLAALDASGQGAAVASSQVARSASRSSGGNSTPALIGAIVGAIAMIASKGMSAASSAKAATEIAAIKAQNRLALAAVRRKRW